MAFDTRLEEGLTAASTAEEVTAYIDIATTFLVDLLGTRGFTIDEWREYRKSIISEETQFINDELSRLEPEQS